MKTVKEFILAFPEPYRSQALENLKNDNCNQGGTYVNDKETALSKAFAWSDTPQGHKYWEVFSENVLSIKPIIPYHAFKEIPSKEVTITFFIKPKSTSLFSKFIGLFKPLK